MCLGTILDPSHLGARLTSEPDIQAVVVYSPPEDELALALAVGESFEAALHQWRVFAEGQIATFRMWRGRLKLIEIGHDSGRLDALWAMLGLNEPAATCASSAPDPVLRLIAAQMIENVAGLRDLHAELQACSVPPDATQPSIGEANEAGLHAALAAWLRIRNAGTIMRMKVAELEAAQEVAETDLTASRTRVAELEAACMAAEARVKSYEAECTSAHANVEDLTRRIESLEQVHRQTRTELQAARDKVRVAEDAELLRVQLQAVQLSLEEIALATEETGAGVSRRPVLSSGLFESVDLTQALPLIN
jgi:hypothetical protein